MEIKELITAIVEKHKEQGINLHSPATEKDILLFEQKLGFVLPPDFKVFYSTCNGLACNEDIFNITPLFEITDYGRDYGKNWFYFSEYMIFSDSWGLRITDDFKYEIFNGSYPEKTMTNSLKEFLERFLRGNVF
jgi:hypothetical protein